jgi:hypothetical protein
MSLGAAEQVTSMLALPSEFRIATASGWLADLDRRLSVRHFASSPIAVELWQQIRDFGPARRSLSVQGKGSERRPN